MSCDPGCTFWRFPYKAFDPTDKGGRATGGTGSPDQLRKGSAHQEQPESTAGNSEKEREGL